MPSSARRADLIVGMTTDTVPDDTAALPGDTAVLTRPSGRPPMPPGVVEDDISIARRKARARRARHIILLIFVLALPFLFRDGLGLGELIAGHPAAAHSTLSWPFSVHLPPKTVDYIPSIVLIAALIAILALPLIGAGRSPHILFRPEDIVIGFDDVVGAGSVVDEVRRTLELFRYHRRFAESMGGTARRAILFEGPPGTGKTYLAKAIAAEAGVPFLFVSSSAFQSMFYGQTNRKVRSYFKALRTYARREGGAIGFIEEIDAIGASRAGMRSGGGGEGVAGVVNELLIQLQSFDQPSFGERLAVAFVDAANRYLPRAVRLRRPVHEAPNVLVVGATNRASDLDPALLRPGRFDRTITVDLPGRPGRREIIDYYLARKAHDLELDDEIVRDDLAGATAGYSPVMIEHLFDEALMYAVRRGAPALSSQDLAEARLSTELGLTQLVVYSDEERRRIATHEAGHATVAAILAPGNGASRCSPSVNAAPLSACSPTPRSRSASPAPRTRCTTCCASQWEAWSPRDCCSGAPRRGLRETSPGRRRPQRQWSGRTGSPGASSPSKPPTRLPVGTWSPRSSPTSRHARPSNRCSSPHAATPNRSSTPTATSSKRYVTPCWSATSCSEKRSSPSSKRPADR